MSLNGVIAAVPTAIDAAGRPLREPFLRHCLHLLDNGCDGLNLLGSTGEASSFSTAARGQVMTWAADALPLERLMVGTGTPSLEETIALTLNADDLGFGVALVLPPYYYKPISEAGLYAYYAAIDAALGARKLRIWFYNYPQMTGIVLPPALIARLWQLNPQRFDGIKDSSGDLAYCADVLKAVPAMQVFPSSEVTLETGRQQGFAGCISATANITAPLSQRLWQGDLTLAPRVAQMRKEIAARPLIPAVRHLVARLHDQDLWRKPLPPFLPLDAVQAQGLEEALAAL